MEMLARHHCRLQLQCRYSRQKVPMSSVLYMVKNNVNLFSDMKDEHHASHIESI